MIRQSILDNKWTMFTAIAVAWAVNTWIAPHLIKEHEDSTKQAAAELPVVQMVGSLVAKPANTAIIHIVGRKLRACEFVNMTAYTHVGSGAFVDAFLERVDAAPAIVSTKPVGNYDLGNWRVWPIAGATEVDIFLQHRCDDTLVFSQIAEVKL